MFVPIEMRFKQRIDDSQESKKFTRIELCFVLTFAFT